MIFSVSALATPLDPPSHPLYPIALNHVLASEDESFLPGLEWSALNDAQRKRVKDELEQLIREQDEIQSRIRLIESLLATHAYLPPVENPEADRIASSFWQGRMPQKRLRQLERLGDSVGYVLQRLRAEPAHAPEYHAILGRLLLEAERVIDSAQGPPELVAQEAAVMWAFGLAGGLGDGLLGTYLQNGLMVTGSMALVATSIVAFGVNIWSRDEGKSRPILFWPGAYGRAYAKVTKSLRRRFWIAVEIGLLKNQVDKNEVLATTATKSLAQAIEKLSQDGPSDLTAIDCAALLQRPAR